MTEDKNNLKIEGLRADVREAIKSFAEKLKTELGENLLSITVVGSSLTEDFRQGQSDINIVLVLGEQNLNSLKIIASMARSMSKRKLTAPLLMTPGYIERSCDVFGIEFLDFQLTHKTIFGIDPFESLRFTKRDVRLQCERELKATLIRLRQGYISAAGNKKLVRDILIATASGLVPLLRAMLWLKNIERPGTNEAVFTKAAKEFSAGMDRIVTARKWRHEKMRLQESEITAAFESIYTAVEKLADIVDKLEV